MWAQWAQYNEFVESGQKSWAPSEWTKQGFKRWTHIEKTQIKLNEINVRGDELLFEQLFLRANTTLSAPVILFLFSFSLFSDPLPFGRSVTLYSFFLNYADRTLVHHLNTHSSICPIRHLLWLFVNGGGWDCTVQRSSPHKCGQKSCYNAFNVIMVAFAFRYFYILIIFACAWNSSLSLNLLGRSPKLPKYLID